MKVILLRPSKVKHFSCEIEIIEFEFILIYLGVNEASCKIIGKKPFHYDLITLQPYFIK